MTPHLFLLLLAAAGTAQTLVLAHIRRKSRNRFPGLDNRCCCLVLESRYSRLFGIANELAGLILYLSVALLIIMTIKNVFPAKTWDLLSHLLIFAGVLISAFLSYLQWKVIKAWCSWCLLSALTLLTMGIIVALWDIGFSA
jgi:uncharacterized membrane protein